MNGLWPPEALRQPFLRETRRLLWSRFGGAPGNYTFKLRVTDSEGTSSADFTTVKFSGR